VEREKELAIDLDRFECLSFDCYGTLVDWERGILASLEPILASRRIASSDERILELYAQAEAAMEAGPFRCYREVLKGVLLAIGEELGFSPSEDELKAFSSSVGDWPPFPDSAAALRSLQRKYRLIILSNVDDDLFELSRRQLGVKFDVVFTSERIGSYKPSPKNFAYLIEKAGVPKEKILHVAQSLYHDIAPAMAMGIATVWVDRRRGLPGSGATPPARAAADFVVCDLLSLAAMAGCETGG